MKPKICIIGENSSLSKLILEYALKNHKPIIAVDEKDRLESYKVEDFILSNNEEKDESVE
jgi:hypothetical protein